MVELPSSIRIHRRIYELLQQGRRGVLVTVVDTAGSTPAKVGAAMLVLPSGKALGTVGGGALENHAIETAKELVGRRTCLLQEYTFGGGTSGDASPERAPPDGARSAGAKSGATPSDAAAHRSIPLPMLCGGKATLFYEYLGSRGSVFIFGAGHVGQALAYHLQPLDLHATLVDTRPGILEEIDGEGITVKPAADYPTAVAEMENPEGSYCVVATHSHEEDYRVLKAVIEAPWQPVYIGVIASAGKAREFRNRLQKECRAPVPLEKLYMPCGLDTGGPTPQEIAISVISEIQAVRFARSGHRHMRERAEDD
jgi:xanthine dehydrogenase accessory factor